MREEWQSELDRYYDWMDREERSENDRIMGLLLDGWVARPGRSGWDSDDYVPVCQEADPDLEVCDHGFPIASGDYHDDPVYHFTEDGVWELCPDFVDYDEWQADPKVPDRVVPLDERTVERESRIVAR